MTTEGEKAGAASLDYAGKGAIKKPRALGRADPIKHPWQRLMQDPRILVGGGILILLLLICLITLPATATPDSVARDSSGNIISTVVHPLFYDRQDSASALHAPSTNETRLWFGTSKLGQSLLGQCLLGGVISLTIGLAAAGISVVLGVGVGVWAGYRGGWVDSVLMRIVDILYALPYILMVILFKIALDPKLFAMFDWLTRHRGFTWMDASLTANLVVLFLSIGLVSWLTMARVIRGQVLSLRTLPFIEAARAAGVPPLRIFQRHLLPNLIGPITVYATLTVPQAILQESLLSFLGIGVQKPLPTWGSLASDGLALALTPILPRWWLLVFPCTLLAVTLLALNFAGDGLRDALDPKRDGKKI